MIWGFCVVRFAFREIVAVTARLFKNYLRIRRFFVIKLLFKMMNFIFVLEIK